jgi:hypothetical protein
VNNYHASFVRYERYNDLCVPVKVRKEMLDEKLTVVRVTELTFPVYPLEASRLSSNELDGWGSVQYDLGAPTRVELIAWQFIRPSDPGAGSPCLALDWRAWKSHEDDKALIASGLSPTLPIEIIQDDESGLTELSE